MFSRQKFNLEKSSLAQPSLSSATAQTTRFDWGSHMLVNIGGKSDLLVDAKAVYVCII